MSEFDTVETNPDSKVHGANIVPSWVLSAPDGPHIGFMNLALREATSLHTSERTEWQMMYTYL